MKQPTMSDLVELFKEHNYVEIGYIDGFKRFYRHN